MSDYKVNFVPQRCDKSCVVACIAMVADVSFEMALKAVNGEIPVQNLTFLKALVRLGFLPMPQISGELMWGRLYIVSVPSLNMLGTMHSIVIDTRNDILEIYDPQMGRPGKLYYTEEKFKCWADSVYVLKT